MSIKQLQYNRNGFTLMEVMVSVSIFTIIMVIGIGSLLTINVSNSQSRSDREAMDKVSFLLESMTRKIRTGVLDSSSSNLVTFFNQRGDRETYEFFAGNPSGQLIYTFEKCIQPIPGVVCTVFDSPEQYDITPQDDLVQLENISFDIIGPGPTVSVDSDQALIIIRIVGTASEKHQQTPFKMQTAVSQRQLQL